MTRECDKAVENPYQSPRQTASYNRLVRKRQRLPWWARPDAPSIWLALPFLALILFGIVVSLLLPIIQWLNR